MTRRDPQHCPGGDPQHFSKGIAILAVIACFSTSSAWCQTEFSSSTETQLRRGGFSSNLISQIGKRTIQPYRRTADAPQAWGQQDALPPVSPDQAPAADSGHDHSGHAPPAGTGGEGSGHVVLPPPPPADSPAPAPESGEIQSVPAPPTSTTATGGKTNGKKSNGKKKKSSAPIVSSIPELPPVSGAPLPSPYGMGAYSAGDQEIYSQEPLKLPPVTDLPVPARTVLPPLSRDQMMIVPLGDAISRILACNSTGLTGLLVTTGADISREGSFKCGFHSSWFNLDRVYDRFLASGESGELLEIPLFFNYAVTNDLEFAFMLPILNYTIKSRILWVRDFRESGVGDMKLSFKYRVFDNAQYQMRGAFGVGFKFPTGSDAKGLGTGKTDFEVYTAFSKNFERVVAHLNLGYVMTGDPNTQFYPDGLADIFYYNIGLEYPHNHNVTIMTEVNGQDWGSEGLRIDVTPGIRYTPTENFAFEVGVPIAATNDQRYGYNYRIVFGVTAFFR